MTIARLQSYAIICRAYQVISSCDGIQFRISWNRFRLQSCKSTPRRVCAAPKNSKRMLQSLKYTDSRNTNHLKQPHDCLEAVFTRPRQYISTEPSIALF